MKKSNQDKMLFSEFSPVSTAQWEEKIKTDLKGADYEKKLIWKSYEGISVRPYYRAEDLEGLEYLLSPPGENPYVRGNKTEKNDWIIRQNIDTEDAAGANRIALDAISKGAGAIGFSAREIASQEQMKQLLAGIDPGKTEINFISSRSYPSTLGLFIDELSARGIEGNTVKGSLNFDPIGYLLLHGNFYQTWEDNIDETGSLIKTIREHVPGFHAVTVNGHLFHEAGATLVQELAFSLATANEYLYALTSKGFTPGSIAPLFRFSFGIGSSYFMEIAKLRAARLLWAALVEQYHPENPDACRMFIHSTTSLWNKTIYDPYVNLLRTTTEGMAAAIGNTDSMTILPFDIPFREADDFSNRIARNQQLILKEESYLDKVADPAAGSYYIENLTDSIATHAWERFRAVEEKGGMIACIRSGFIQDEIMESCNKKDMDIAQRKLVILGTNQYANPLESMQEPVREHPVNVPAEPAPFKKLRMYRGAEAFEEIRLATEKHAAGGGKIPSVFLLTIGSPGMRKARAAFSTNFFGCAGYTILDNPGFNTPAEGVTAALDAAADIIVICSSDEEYVTLVPEICSRLKSQPGTAEVIVAGYPKEIIGNLKAAGVDNFIHVRTNVLEFLSEQQKKFGIIK
jgi:methylmalonyl-CoA mutase